MSQPQELPSHNPTHEVPQAPEQYQAPVEPQPPESEYVPTPSQTPAPIPPQFYPPPPQTYGSPDQYGSPAQPLLQVPQEYYQQPAQGQYDAEKGGVLAHTPAPGAGTSVPAYTPPVERTARSGTAPPAMITLFGKQFTKKDIIISAVAIAVVLIVIIGFGAGLGAKAAKNKDLYRSGGGRGGDRGGRGGDRGGRGGSGGSGGSDDSGRSGIDRCEEKYDNPADVQACRSAESSDGMNNIRKRLHLI